MSALPPKADIAAQLINHLFFRYSVGIDCWVIFKEKGEGGKL